MKLPDVAASFFCSDQYDFSKPPAASHLLTQSVMQEFPFDEIEDLYGRVILDHYRNPRRAILIENADVEYDELNPICGDRVVLQLRMDGDRIAEAGFQGEGCSITRASASMMADLLGGMTLAEAEELAEAVRRMMLQGTRPNGGMGDLEALQGVRRFPVRIKCALLAWTALEEGLEEYRAGTVR